MSTPEAKVKNKIKQILKDYGAYQFSPQTGGYGRSGIPDIIACYQGKFIAVECKAGSNKPTRLQEKELRDICSACGYGMVVNENGIEHFRSFMEGLRTLRS